MENKKLFARIAPPDYIDMEIYFDFKEEAAQGYLTVIHDDSRHYSGYKSPEWEELEHNLPYVSEFLCDILNGCDEIGYKNMTELFRDYFPNVTNTRTVHRLKELIFEYDENGLEDETAVNLLELYTGKKWDYSHISGSCQGDSATVYFPAIENETDRKKFVNAISAYYFGTGYEVEIHDGENEPADADEISGYWDYIPVPWPTETEVKEYLSEQTGIEPENIVLYIPTNSCTFTSWTYEIA